MRLLPAAAVATTTITVNTRRARRIGGRGGGWWGGQTDGGNRRFGVVVCGVELAMRGSEVVACGSVEMGGSSRRNQDEGAPQAVNLNEFACVGRGLLATRLFLLRPPPARVSH